MPTERRGQPSKRPIGKAARPIMGGGGKIPGKAAPFAGGKQPPFAQRADAPKPAHRPETKLDGEARAENRAGAETGEDAAKPRRPRGAQAEPPRAPSPGRPSYGKPYAGNPGAGGKPYAGGPGTARPSAAGSGTGGKPYAGNPGAGGKPYAGGSRTGGPGTARPSAAGSGTARPYAPKPRAGGPEAAKSVMGDAYAQHTSAQHTSGQRTSVQRPGEDRPYAPARGMGRTFATKPGARPYVPRPAAAPNAAQTGAGQPGTGNPGAGNPGTGQPGTGRPGVGGYAPRPFAARPFAAGAGRGRPGRPAPKPAGPLPIGQSARGLALTALCSVNAEGGYSTLILNKLLRESKLEPIDKRLATEIFYGTLEHKMKLDYVLARHIAAPPPPIVMDILRMGVYQLMFLSRIPDSAAVDEAVKLARAKGCEAQTGMVNAVLRNVIRERGQIPWPDAEQDPVAAMSVEHSLPQHLVRRLIAAYGHEGAEAIASYRPDERCMTIRPNTLKTDAKSLEALLTKNGWRYEPGEVPGAYRVFGAGELIGHPSFREGLFSIQSEGSMLAAMAVKPRVNWQIIDACAAPGGKSALLCELMRGTGRVYAWDLHAHRVELLKQTGSRLGLDNLRPAVRDATQPARADELLRMDAVLLDAPCSGLGVMMNKPEVKYRHSEEGIAQLAELQRTLLDRCCVYVREGGLLVYATCTLLPEENALQVEAFLARHPEYEPDPAADWLPPALRGQYREGMIQLLPQQGMDGFFIARLRRKL